MRILYIDTHLKDINIILFNDNKIIKEEHIIDKKDNSKLLWPSLAKVIEKNDFDEILVVNGPGSFTGVRLGVTIAKTLAYTMNKKIKTIDYLDVMHTSCNDKICAFSDGNGYYLKDFINNKLVYLTNKEYQEYIKNKNVTTDVTIDYNNLLTFAKSIKYSNPHSVNPLYVKKISVEL